jgi:transcriptional antiterminator
MNYYTDKQDQLAEPIERLISQFKDYDLDPELAERLIDHLAAAMLRSKYKPEMDEAADMLMDACNKLNRPE